MSFERWGSNFEGAFTSPSNLRNVAGVYVIWCKIGDSWKVLDVGESGEVRERVVNHDRADCWEEHCSGTIYYAAAYIDDENVRLILESKIRQETNPPCGER